MAIVNSISKDSDFSDSVSAYFVIATSRFQRSFSNFIINKVFLFTVPL